MGVITGGLGLLWYARLSPRRDTTHHYAACALLISRELYLHYSYVIITLQR